MRDLSDLERSLVVPRCRRRAPNRETVGNAEMPCNTPIALFLALLLGLGMTILKIYFVN